MSNPVIPFARSAENAATGSGGVSFDMNTQDIKLGGNVKGTVKDSKETQNTEQENDLQQNQQNIEENQQSVENPETKDDKSKEVVKGETQ